MSARRGGRIESSQLGVLRFGDLDVQLPAPFTFKYLDLDDERNRSCSHCGAKTWKEESINCCGNGKYVVHRLKPLPAGVLDTFMSKEFSRNQRRYNNLFSFTCLGASSGKAWCQSKPPSMMKLHGRPYHRIMDSFRNSYNNTVTNNARMYIYDHELQSTGRSLRLDGETVKFLATQLRENNSWVKQYRALLLEIDNSDEDNMCISFQQSSRVQPTARTEIAALLYKDNSDTPGKRHVYTYPRNGPPEECDKPRFVPIYTSSYLPLQYPLLYFSGESGWSPGDFKEARRDRTLSTRGNIVNAPFYGRQRLLIEPVFHTLSTVAQEWACDQYARTDDLKLSYIERQLPKKRLTTKNAIHAAPPDKKVGKRLPASFHGSHVNRKRKQLDAMAVVARKGPPTLMVTFTANPAWPEITRNLKPGQTGMDRPDLISRVFKVKLKHLLADLRQGLFGKAQYMMHVIEWQARGVVHAHIIVMYEDGPEKSGNVDDWIWTNLPDASIADGKLREKVLAYHIHKKCGKHNPSSPCMKVNPKTKHKYCSKHYPQPFRTSMHTNTSGRAEYTRLNNGDKATIKCKNGENKTVDTEIDNRDVVPYNPYLLMKYDSHICIDLVTANAVIAYLYKYAYKKEDGVTARITYGKDEIEAYRSVRYISSSEAIWHMFGFHTNDRFPSVELLYVHHAGEQPVIHDEADEPEQRQAAANNAVSNLMRYFGRPVNQQCSGLTYPEYYERYSIEKDRRSSKRRRPTEDEVDDEDIVPSDTPFFRDRYGNYVYLKTKQSVSRLQYMSPDQGDIWFLRLLLIKRAAYTFSELRSINNIEYPSYEKCARELGLVHDVDEYTICIQEAMEFSTARELRRLYTTLILHGAPASQLWELFHEDLSQDFTTTMAADASEHAALKHIDLMLAKHGKSTNQFGLPTVEHDNTEYDRLLHAFNRFEQAEVYRDMKPNLTVEQQNIFDKVTTSALHDTGGVYMIDAPAGTGKSYTICAISAHLRAQGKLVLCAASTGIAALLLPGGLTAHSTFKLPFGDDATEGSVCGVKAETQRAEVLKKSSLIVWDEIVMSSKFSPEALHLTLQDLCQNDLPFGGKTILFSGDWRQVAPVLQYGTEVEIVERAFLSSYLWEHVHRFRLTKSMRTKDDLPYAKTVLAIGEGKIEPVQLNDGSAAIPLKHTFTNDDGSETTCQIDGTTEFQDLIDKVYPDLLQSDHRTYNDRAILAATNDNVDSINEFILDKMPGRVHHLLSSDKIVTDDDEMPNSISVEYLNKVDVAGTPPHDLNLKIGALVFFIRNINFDSGLVNGKKGIIRGISRRIIDVEVISDEAPIVKIPRICFEIKVGARGITFHRFQFPVRLCYAMSINKSQGSTLTYVGLDLRGEVFCHGQLYVAVSRTTCRDNILCLVQPDRLIDGVPHVHNVVFTEFIIAATGHAPPTFDFELSVRGSGNSHTRASSSSSNADNNTDSDDNSNTNSSNDNGNNYPPNGHWTVVPEIGDGNCLLRCISRRVHGTPDLHHVVRQHIVSHITENLHTIIPGSGFNTFHDSIFVGIDEELVQMAGSPAVKYYSVDQYLQYMSQNYTYASSIELVAASHLYQMEFRITLQGQPYPTPPTQNICDVLYYPSSAHYVTLRYST